MIKAIYIHIPFCSYKCPYCDFLSVVESPISEKEYIKALFKEFELYKNLEVCIETLYFGGGTPSLLSPDEIGNLCAGIVVGEFGTASVTPEKLM
ncbi:MAG TPA: coproporphyrinogen III oxidase family protein, partial [Aquificaceae bacterium]|nr:coproporphyrinogen III oxidase family protein [Aquificaceae bacterium]